MDPECLDSCCVSGGYGRGVTVLNLGGKLDHLGTCSDNPGECSTTAKEVD